MLFLVIYGDQQVKKKELSTEVAMTCIKKLVSLLKLIDRLI